MSHMINLTDNQRRAIVSRDGRLFLAAGAGSGKTGVVTRRFVYALATGRAAIDEILTITFTRKAAAEMMRRIRDYLRDGILVDAEPDTEQARRMAAAYRDIERAQISTIDSFCTSVLRANALAAGLDPEFRAADESQAQVIMEEAFERSLIGFVRDHGDAAVELIRCYDANLSGMLYKAVTGIYGRLRNQGGQPELPLPAVRVEEAQAELRAASAAVLQAHSALSGKPSKTRDTAAERVASLLEALDSAPDDLELLESVESGEAQGKSRLKEIYDECQAYNEARQRLAKEIRSRHAHGTLMLFNDLLTGFAREYERQKRRLGVLDLGDLTTKTRDLLAANRSVRERVASRYKLVMVDEFQDTNPLQQEIVELVAGELLMMVGDQNQSIYGFRDAVVELFQQEDARAAAAGYRIELNDNFRSQPEILAFVDFIFNREDMLAPGYIELNPAAPHEPGQGEDPRIEVLLIDKRRNSTKDNLEEVDQAIVDQAEAQLIAERLQQLFGEGRFNPGDCAILVRKSAYAEPIREALAGAGIEHYLASGRSYFQKLELGDVINIFKLIVNPLDDIAMLGALRSPMAGLSDDALYWLREAARDGRGRPEPLWRTIASDRKVDHLDAAAEFALRSFAGTLGELRATSLREPLQSTARRVIDINDYAAAAAGGADGKQKLANLMMLLDLAADFESAWGNDVAEFADFLQQQKEIRAKQADAPTEEEGVAAVRIMTMHAAKGLEFPLVVMPHLAWKKIGRDDDIIKINREGSRVGIKYVSDDGFAGHAFDFDELKREEVARGKAEEHRLGYVSMTRAMRHLILSGSAPVDNEPNRDNETDPPLNWLREYLELGRARDEELGSPEIIELPKGNRVAYRIEADPEAAAARLAGANAVHKDEEPPSLPADLSVLPPASYMPPVISPTAIDVIRACPRRYYLERVIRAGAVLPEMPAMQAARGGEGLNATLMGTLVHALLEKSPIPLGDTDWLTDEQIEEGASLALPGRELSPGDRGRARQLAANIRRTGVITEIDAAAAAGAWARELPFSTMVGPSILRGKMDVFIEREAGSLVIDYKTGRYSDIYPEAKVMDDYQFQMSAYALAASRLRPGPVEVVIALLNEPVGEVRLIFDEARLDGLEAELNEQIGRLADGAFAPLAVFDPGSCESCAGNRIGGPLCAVALAGQSPL